MGRVARCSGLLVATLAASCWSGGSDHGTTAVTDASASSARRVLACDPDRDLGEVGRRLISDDWAARQQGLHDLDSVLGEQRRRLLPCLVVKLRIDGRTEEAIEQIGPMAVLPLLALISEGNTRHRSLARYLVASIVTLDADVGLGEDHGFGIGALVTAMVDSLGDPHDAVRAKAAGVLSRLGPRARRAEAALRKLSADRSPEVRYAAGYALSSIGAPR